MIRATAFVTVAVLVHVATIAVAGEAIPGKLDFSFGEQGKVVTKFTAGGDRVAGLAIQPDGRIVAAGEAGSEEFALARYTSDGSLDPSFGSGGKVTTTFSTHDWAVDVLIQPDGKIVAAGTTGLKAFALARYTSDGSLDPSFDEDGKVVTNFSKGFDRAYAAALQSDGKIVVVGRARGKGGRFALARYRSNGKLDKGFGGNGKVLTNITPRYEEARSVAIQSDGKIVVAGRTGGGGGRFALARYLDDGTLDTGFGGDGTVLTNLSPGPDAARDMAIQAKGRIVVVGRAGGKGGQFALARYRRDGKLDKTFNGSGAVLLNLTPGLDIALGVAIDSDGRIVAAGHAGGTRKTPRNHRFGLVRFKLKGKLDRSFAGNGKRLIDFSPGDDWAQDVVIEPGGKIVAGGGAGRGRAKFALTRVLAA